MRNSTKAIRSDELEEETAAAVRELLKIGEGKYSGVPLKRLIKNLKPLTKRSLTIDLAAARQIGVPVVVLRDHGTPAYQPVFDKLSEREQEVARHIAAGRRNAEISRLMRISVSTVKDHVHSALKKTGLRTRTELAAKLVREGL